MKTIVIFLPPIVWMITWFLIWPSETLPLTPMPKYRWDLVPWTIVSSNDGKYNYVTEGGYIFPLHYFDTMEAACKQRDEMKAMSERDVRTPEEQKRIDKVAATDWNLESDCERN